MTDNRFRCVITGLGTINAIGTNVDECWDNIKKSVSGIGHTKAVDTEGCYSDFAAESKTEDSMDTGDFLDRASFLCLKAADEAMKDAGLESFEGSRRASVIMGSCVGGGKSIDHYYTMEKRAERVLEMPISPIANHVAERVKAGGVVTNIANACAAGTMSISYAADLIREGKADIVMAGGADSFSSVPYAGFLSLKALSSEPCSPFNHSHGITLGEGAGALIVESYEHAVKRGAKIYCEVLGSGISADAHHITAPREDGEGQMYAIRAAISHSGLESKDIDYVNAHGTGTPKNDEAEFLSLHTIFDEADNGLSVSSTKAMTGHCLGAAGAIEAVFAIKALENDMVPPTLGYSDEDLEVLKEKAGALDFCPNTVKNKKLTNVMSNSFAFGGTNASIIFSKEAGDIQGLPEKKDIAVTGLGLVTPFGNTKESYLEAVKEKKNAKGELSQVGSDDYKALNLKMSFYRKLDHFSQLEAVSGMAALKDAAFEATPENEFRTGIIVGTSEGALSSACDFQKLIVEKGNAGGSAFKFPNTVYNAAGGYLSICSGLKGVNATLTNGAQSALQAISYAMNVIRQGAADAMITSGNDDNGEIMTELFETAGLTSKEPTELYGNSDGFNLSDGSVSLLLETAENAAKRNASVYCMVTGYGMAHEDTKINTLSGSSAALKEAILLAAEDAGTDIRNIDAVIGFANGSKDTDSAELEVMKEMFADTPVISVKERLGEGRAATAALEAAHAALMLNGDIEKCEGYIPAGEAPQKCEVISKDLNRILAVSFAAGGSYTAVIFERK